MDSSQSRVADVLRLAYAQRKLVEAIGRRTGVFEADLPDLLQRVVLVLLAKHQQIVPGCERGFLAQVARREARHVRRTYRRRAEESCETIFVCEAAQPDERFECKRRLTRVNAFMLDAPVPLREVWVRHIFGDQSCNEVALATGLALGTVKSRLRRVTEALRRAVGEA